MKKFSLLLAGSANPAQDSNGPQMYKANISLCLLFAHTLTEPCCCVESSVDHDVDGIIE